jgi:hypothetical protein
LRPAYHAICLLLAEKADRRRYRDLKFALEMFVQRIANERDAERFTAAAVAVLVVVTAQGLA